MGFRGVDGACGGATLDNGHYLTSRRKPAAGEDRKTQRNQEVTATLDPGDGAAYTRRRRRRKSEYARRTRIPAPCPEAGRDLDGRPRWALPASRTAGPRGMPESRRRARRGS